MADLIDTLISYAAENRVPRFQREFAAQNRALWRNVENLTEKLKALGPEAEEWVENLRKELLKLEDNHERAVLLAGISIGLELERL